MEKNYSKIRIFCRQGKVKVSVTHTVFSLHFVGFYCVITKLWLWLLAEINKCFMLDVFNAKNLSCYFFWIPFFF